MPGHVCSGPIGSSEFDSFSGSIDDGSVACRKGECDILDFVDFGFAEEVSLVMFELFNQIFMLTKIMFVPHDLFKI